jgi:hypothetical protein
MLIFWGAVIALVVGLVVKLGSVGFLFEGIACLVRWSYTF